MPEQHIEAIRAFIEGYVVSGRTLAAHIFETYCVKLVAANAVKMDQTEHVGHVAGLIVSADCAFSVMDAVAFLVEHGLHDVCQTTLFEVTELGEIGAARTEIMPFKALFGVRLIETPGSDVEAISL